MKKILLTFLVFISTLLLHAQAPTTPASGLYFDNIDGDRFRLIYTRGNGQNVLIIAKEGSAVTSIPVDGIDYTANASFGLGNEIATDEFVVYEGAGNAPIIVNLNFNTAYHFRIFEFNGAGVTTEYLTTSFEAGNQTTITTPTTQASNISFSNILGYQMNVNWTNGDGTGRILIARENTAVNIEPTDLVAYGASQNYGIYEIGVGNYVVYRSTGSTALIVGLDPNTTYHFALYEYNGLNGKVFLRPGAIAENITADFPTIASSNLNIWQVDGNRMNINFSPGNGQNRIIVMKEGSAVDAIPIDGSSYTASATFGAGSDLGGGNYVVGANVNNLNPGTTYHIKVFEFNGSGNATYYLLDPTLVGSQATLSNPTTQASGLNFTNVEGTEMTVNWTRGNGQNAILIAKEGSSVDVEPQDMTTYTWNNGVHFGDSEIGNTGNFVVYSSSGSTRLVKKFTPNTTYHFAIFEFNGNTGRLYLRPGATGSITTPAAPTVEATGMFFRAIEGNKFRYTFTPGNGGRRIVVAKKGSTVTAIPADGTDYASNDTFGLGDEIAPGEFVIYDGVSFDANLLGLEPASDYFLKVFEYNGSGTGTFYLTTAPEDFNQQTLSAPTTQASNINFTNVEGVSFKLNWTNGSGLARLVIMKEGSPVDIDPTDLVSYYTHNSFGQYLSSEISAGTGNYGVYSGSSNTVDIYNLKPNTEYFAAIFEYNGSSGRIYLKPAATANIITASTPTVAPGAIEFSQIEADKIRMTWPIGNGNRRIVIAKKGSAPTAIPVDNTTYTANETFGLGQEIETDEFVVYTGTAGRVFGGVSFTTTLGLEIGTEYFFRVYEYNVNDTETFYLTSSFGTGNQFTLTHPTTQTSNYFVNSKTSNSINLSWTNGDGTTRLIIAKEEGAVDTEPVDFNSYSAYQSFSTFASTEIGTDNYGVYQGTATTTNITNLLPNTTYHFACFEYNGSDSRLYLRPAYTFSVKTNVTTPSLQVSSALFNEIGGTSMRVDFTKGNGTNRIVLVKEGAAVDVDPTDLNDYAADPNFGNGTEIGTGNFVVYNGVGENFILKNLNHSTKYHFAFYEYSTDASGSLYLTPALTAEEFTAFPPSVSATNYTTTPPCTSDVNIEWTSSIAFGSLVVVSETPLTSPPTNGVNYTFNFDYGVGDAVANGFVVYKDTGDLVPINLLTEFQLYYVSIFEFNGTEADPVFFPTGLLGVIGDTINPTTVSQDIVVPLGINGTASITSTSIDDGSFDDCTLASLTIDKSTFDCSDIGIVSVRLTATDAYGNTSFSDAAVTIVDNMKPSLSTVADKTVEPIGGTCDYTIPDYTGETTVTDNCNVQSVIQSPTTGTTISGHQTEQIITLTANDGNGNTEFTTFNVTLDCTILSNDDFDIEGFLIYPNPVKDVLTIKSGNLIIDDIEIFDTLGKSLKKVKVINETISTKNLPIGVYMLRITSDKGIIIRKIVKI